MVCLVGDEMSYKPIKALMVGLSGSTRQVGEADALEYDINMLLQILQSYQTLATYATFPIGGDRDKTLTEAEQTHIIDFAT